ncbi:MAG: hypothetical protein H6Q67_1755 [Firmicutes bacterium]|nr:hypothetical protein [Bacillota bacterium]
MTRYVKRELYEYTYFLFFEGIDSGASSSRILFWEYPQFLLEVFSYQ